MIWRLGTVPYLNADPLAAALREQDVALLVGDAVELSAEVPSQLIGSLLRGSVEAALVSTAAVVPHPELAILPEMCISSRGAVRSITLYTRTPIDRVRTVALDASSRSAHALTQVLLAEKWGKHPEYVTLPPDLPRMLEQADAALLIGNPALVSNYKLDSGDWPGLVRERYDLGEVWTGLTGLPFVYAIWAVSPAALAARSRDLDRLTRLLLRAKAWGLRRRGMLAARGAEELGLPYDLALDYITDAIRYDLGPQERAGMERFCELAIRHGVLPEGSAVRLAEPALAPARF